MQSPQPVQALSGTPASLTVSLAAMKDSAGVGCPTLSFERRASSQGCSRNSAACFLTGCGVSNLAFLLGASFSRALSYHGSRSAGFWRALGQHGWSNTQGSGLAMTPALINEPPPSPLASITVTSFPRRRSRTPSVAAYGSEELGALNVILPGRSAS